MELADPIGLPASRSGIGGKEQNSVPPPNAKSLSAGAYSPRTLRSEIKSRGRLPATEVIELGRVLATALNHLHSHGLVHRDIKPANIVYACGVPKLADIGLVTDASDTCSIVGTEGYIPPEGPGTPLADLFSLGKVLYEAATGKDRRDYPALPDELRAWPDAPLLAELNAVILRACAPNPRERYPSAEEMRANLELLQQGKSVKTRQRLRWAWTVCKKAGLATTLITSALIAAFHFARDDSDKYLKSSSAEVNNLVQQGHDLIRLEKRDQIRNAVAKFKQAIEIEPDFAPAHNGLFHAYVHLLDEPGSMEGIRAETKKLMALNPLSAEARGADAFVKWLDWKFQEALAESGEATKLPAISKEGEGYKYLEYGYFLEETGDSTNALRQYKLAHKFLPNDPTILDHLGQPYLMQGDYAEAEKHFRASIVQQPDHRNGHNFLALTFEQTGRFEKAIAEWEACRRLSGDKEADLQRYFKGLLAALQEGGATAYWKKKLEEAQKDPQPKLYYMATLHARLGKKDQYEMDQAYTLLKKSCQEQHDFGGAMYDLCWDHNDPKFRSIMKSIGLIK